METPHQRNSYLIDDGCLKLLNSGCEHMTHPESILYQKKYPKLLPKKFNSWIWVAMVLSCRSWPNITVNVSSWRMGKLSMKLMIWFVFYINTATSGYYSWSLCCCWMILSYYLYLYCYLLLSSCLLLSSSLLTSSSLLLSSSLYLSSYLNFYFSRSFSRSLLICCWIYLWIYIYLLCFSYLSCSSSSYLYLSLLLYYLSIYSSLLFCF